jgi:hypothetical protein
LKAQEGVAGDVKMLDRLTAREVSSKVDPKLHENLRGRSPYHASSSSNAIKPKLSARKNPFVGVSCEASIAAPSPTLSAELPTLRKPRGSKILR